MNAPVTPPSELRRQFDRLAAKAPAIRATTAEQRADKLLRLLKATLDARPRSSKPARRNCASPTPTSTPSC